jgi:hypothetical protein
LTDCKLQQIVCTAAFLVMSPAVRGLAKIPVIEQLHARLQQPQERGLSSPFGWQRILNEYVSRLRTAVALPKR